jgi:hypothetical protein
MGRLARSVDLASSCIEGSRSGSKSGYSGVGLPLGRVASVPFRAWFPTLNPLPPCKSGFSAISVLLFPKAVSRPVRYLFWPGPGPWDRAFDCGSMAGMASPCPCCNFSTLTERGILAICPVCYWQDEHGHDRKDSHNLVSLPVAQAEYAAIQTSDHLWIGEVRPPLPTETLS